jgi:hypothetical protein
VGALPRSHGTLLKLLQLRPFRMVNRRPTPELVRARQFEIKRRYEHHRKVGKRTRSMAAIRLAELTRWLDDAAGQGAELEPSEWSAGIGRIFVHHFVVLSDGNRRAADWLNTYCPWIERRDREHMITEANHCPLKWSADKLAWKIHLTDAKRTALKITTIGAIDVGKDERKARRKARRAELMRNLRATRKATRVNTI